MEEKTEESSNVDATNLLLGLSDSELYTKMDGKSDARGRGVNNLIVGTSKWQDQHARRPPRLDHRSRCARLSEGWCQFGGLLANKDDLLTSAPLEEAYLWALACRLAVRGSVSFNSDATFFAKCMC